MNLDFRENGNACPHCGSRRLRAVVASAHDREAGHIVHVLECKDCVFAWQFPVSHLEEESTRFFEAAYAAAVSEPTSYFNPARREAVASIQAALLATVDCAGRTLLDLGGGNGYFARAATTLGWKVTLVDPSLNPTEFVGSGIEAIRGTTSHLTGRLFDVVTMWDVIEHLPAPGLFLKDSAEFVKPGGTLILETGNYKSAARAEEGTNHWIYQADHRWYFSPESAKALMRAVGLGNIQLYPKVMRPDWSGDPRYAGPSLRQTLIHIASHPLSAAQALSKHVRLSKASTWQAAGLSIFIMYGKRPS